MRITPTLVFFCCIACAVAAGPSPKDSSKTAAAGTQGSQRHWRDDDGEMPVFKVSAFKDITAYVLTATQQEAKAKGILDIQLKWVRNADEAHADLRSWAADLASMSYDDTLSMALQENYPDVVAAWPVHASMMNLCGTIDVSKGLVYVGIDTDTGYARMLREQLKKTMSPADYAKIQWVYAGATNLRFEQLQAGTLNATLLNPPFTVLLSSNIPCQPFWKLTGPIQGTVGNVHRSAIESPRKSAVLRKFFECYKHATLDMKNNAPKAIAGLASFYNTTSAIASQIYSKLWELDGIQTSFCFDYNRLANVESIFAANTGITVPNRRWWVMDWGCGKRY